MIDLENMTNEEFFEFVENFIADKITIDPILLKEADIIVEDKDYTADECRYVTGQVMRHIMSFSKKDISNVTNKYESIIDKIMC